MEKEMRLIEANALIKDILNAFVKSDRVRDVIKHIQFAPTVDAVPVDEHRRLCHELYLQGKMEGAFEATQGMDAAPVVHGYWIECSNSRKPCSVCGYRAHKTNYCPNCGSCMDGRPKWVE